MRYESPANIESAVALLRESKGQGKVLAGGTDLLVHLRAGTLSPPVVVDIKKIAETREIVAENGGFRIGAAVAGAELGEHPELSKAGRAWSRARS